MKRLVRTTTIWSFSNASTCSVYFTDVSRCKDESGTPSMKFKNVIGDERYVYTVQSIDIQHQYHYVIHVPGLGSVKHIQAVLKCVRVY